MIGRMTKWLRRNREKVKARIKLALPKTIHYRIYQLLVARNAMMSRIFFNAQMRTPEVRDRYDRMLAANVADVLLKIANRFYADLSVDARSVPLVKALESFREKLPMGDFATREGLTDPLLIRFERAFALAEAGRASEAVPLFEAVFRDPAARKFVKYDPYVKEAVARSGEFVGRYHEKRGDTDASIAIYREILSISPAGQIARRLALLLCRRGHLREAAEVAEIASLSKPNLFPRLPPRNLYIAAIETELGK